jgi:hypothetical protein
MFQNVMTVKRINCNAMWLAMVAIVLSLVSCDPMSSVEYKIYNKTSDTVTVAMHKEILSSSYKGFDIQESDSVITHYSEADSVSVAVLAPDMVLTVDDEWSGLYHEEQVIPLWKYTKTITVGKTELPAAAWDNESAWHLKTEGGGKFEGESRYYSLILRDM